MYVVYTQANGVWLPISRPFHDEHEAQDWALDLDRRWAREVRVVDEED